MSVVLRIETLQYTCVFTNKFLPNLFLFLTRSYTSELSIAKHVGEKSVWLLKVSVQSSSVAQSCPILCDLMDCSKPGFPVHHQLPELLQTHVHRVGEAIQPSHPLLSPSPPAFNLSQHQGLFKWVSSSHQVVKVLELQLQQQSFRWIFRTDFLLDGLVGSPCSPRGSQESSSTPQLKSISSLAFGSFYNPTLTSIHDYWKNHSFDQMYFCQQSNVSPFYYASRFAIAFLPRSKVF